MLELTTNIQETMGNTHVPMSTVNYYMNKNPKRKILLTHESQNSKPYEGAMRTYESPLGTLIFCKKFFVTISPSGEEKITTYHDQGILFGTNHYICKSIIKGSRLYYMNNCKNLFVLDLTQMSNPDFLYSSITDFEIKKNQLRVYSPKSDEHTNIHIHNLNNGHIRTIPARCENANYMVQKGKVYYVKGTRQEMTIPTKIHAINVEGYCATRAEDAIAGNFVINSISKFQGIDCSLTNFTDLKAFFSLMNDSCDIMITNSSTGIIDIYIVDLSSRVILKHLQPFNNRRTIDTVEYDEITNSFSICYSEIDNKCNDHGLTSHFKVSD